MPLLYQARQKMLTLEPMLGSVWVPASLTTTTAVVTALATGTVSSGQYVEKWLLRPLGATADRTRVCSSFTSTTGTLTHTGANYSDTTATGESLEIHEHRPGLLDQAITEALAAIRYVGRSDFPSRPDGRYALGGYTWFTEPSGIVRFGRRQVAVLTPNRHFDSWGVMSTAGLLQPDGWTLAGSGATFARSAVTRRGPYSLSVTRSGTDATVDALIPAIYSDASGDNIRAKTVASLLVGRSANPSSLRVRTTSEDGSFVVLSTTNSGYHTGSGTWQPLSAEHTVHAAAEWVRVSARVEVNEAALLDELCLAYGPINDDIRRDQSEISWIDRPYAYDQGPLLWKGPQGIGEQLVMESRRLYQQFDPTRIAAGTADSDTTDCPIDLLAYKALAIFFRRNAGHSPLYAARATEYEQAAGTLQAQHLAERTDEEPAQGGARMVTGRAYGTRALIQ